MRYERWVEDASEVDRRRARSRFDCRDRCPLADGSAILPVLRRDGLLQMISEISDIHAPRTFTYRIAPVDGGRLEPLPDGGARVLDAAGSEVASVLPPWATDAGGRSVPTRYEVVGDTLTQVIDVDAVPNVAFPIVADPGVSGTHTQYRVTNVVKKRNWTNRREQIGVCKIERGAGGGQCTISSSKTVQTSIQTGLGASVADISSE